VSCESKSESDEVVYVKQVFTKYNVLVKVLYNNVLCLWSSSCVYGGGSVRQSGQSSQSINYLKYKITNCYLNRKQQLDVLLIDKLQVKASKSQGDARRLGLSISVDCLEVQLLTLGDTSGGAGSPGVPGGPGGRRI